MYSSTVWEAGFPLSFLFTFLSNYCTPPSFFFFFLGLVLNIINRINHKEMNNYPGRKKFAYLSITITSATNTIFCSWHFSFFFSPLLDDLF